MTTKSLRKQLLAAIAMVLVATIALGSSTFAWFAANTRVEASTATINATSDQPFLMISNASAGTYGTTTDISDADASVLKLVRPMNLKTALATDTKYYAAAGDTEVTDPTAATAPSAIVWATTYSKDPAQVQATNVPTAVDTADLGDYVLTKDVYLKTSANTSGKLLKMVAPTLTDATPANSIGNAYRILAVNDTGEWMLYNKGTDAITESDATNHLAATIGDTTPIHITLYFYFDGVDDASYSNNATNLENIAAVVAFECEPN